VHLKRICHFAWGLPIVSDFDLYDFFSSVLNAIIYATSRATVYMGGKIIFYSISKSKIVFASMGEILNSETFIIVSMLTEYNLHVQLK